MTFANDSAVRRIAAGLAACLMLAAMLTVAPRGAVAQSAPPVVAADTNAASAERTRSFLDEPDQTGQTGDVPSMGATLARLVVIMLLLLALLVGGLMVFKRVARRGIRIGGGGSRPLQMVDKLALGPKSSICLIRTCGRTIVVGVSEKEMSVLMEVGPEEEATAKAFANALDSANSPAPKSEQRPG